MKITAGSMVRQKIVPYLDLYDYAEVVLDHGNGALEVKMRDGSICGWSTMVTERLTSDMKWEEIDAD